MYSPIPNSAVIRWLSVPRPNVFLIRRCNRLLVILFSLKATFVSPAEAGHTRKVRIFTPAMEMPFAGHPNVGTAFTLATAGAFGTFDTSISVTFEEKADLVPITIHKREGNAIWCELAAPQRLCLGKTISAEFMASIISSEGLIEVDP